MSMSRLLLRKALAALGICQVSGSCHPRGTPLARIKAYLSDESEKPHPAIAIARSRWGMVSFLRVDPDERHVEVASDGVWVRAWIKVGHADGPHVPPDVARRYQQAVSVLPEFTRRVFTAHRVERLDPATIARRYGITDAEVETLIADALAPIVRHMRDR